MKVIWLFATVTILGWGPLGCATDGTDDPNELADEDGEDGGEDGEDGEDGGEDGKQVTATDGEDGSEDGGEDGDFPPDTSLTSTPESTDGEDLPLTVEDPVIEDPVSAPVQTNATSAWTPDNSGLPPTPIKQADLMLQCQQMGPGVNAGFVRVGCKALTRDGTHYGIVKGWWQVVRRDGVRTKAKSLNFREGGYDMAFDVDVRDAAGGIDVRPGLGEQHAMCH